MRCSAWALENGRSENRVAGKSNRQRPERLVSRGGLSEPDAKWLYQTLKGVVGGIEKTNDNEWRVLKLDARSVNPCGPPHLGID